MQVEPTNEADVSPLDFAALTGTRPGRAPRLKADGQAWRNLIVRGAVGACLVLAGLGLVVLYVFVFVEQLNDGGPNFALVVGGIATAAAFLAMGGRIIFLAVRVDALRLGGPARRARLGRFAHDNEFATFMPEIDATNHPGFFFESVRRPRMQDVISLDRGAIEIGNLVSQGTKGNRQLALVNGFIRIALPARLPHLLALSRVDRGHSAISVQLLDKQMLSLEGDFDKHFTLYAPRGYERDALYVFGPDLMSRLIDHVDQFDVEIVDDWLQVYSHRPFDMLDPKNYRFAMGVATAVGHRVIKQASRYVDGRAETPTGVSADAIAPGGRRLVSLPSMMFVGIVLAAVIGAVLRALIH